MISAPFLVQVILGAGKPSAFTSNLTGKPSTTVWGNNDCTNWGLVGFRSVVMRASPTASPSLLVTYKFTVISYTPIALNSLINLEFVMSSVFGFHNINDQGYASIWVVFEMYIGRRPDRDTVLEPFDFRRWIRLYFGFQAHFLAQWYFLVLEAFQEFGSALFGCELI